MFSFRQPQDTPVQTSFPRRRRPLTPNDRVIMYIVHSTNPTHPALEFARKEGLETAELGDGTTHIVAPWDDLRVLEEICKVVSETHAARERAR